MSYILEALKKAESERRLGQVPSVHAQPLVAGLHDRQPAFWHKPLPWIMLAALMALVAALAWVKPWQDAHVSGQQTTMAPAGAASGAPPRPGASNETVAQATAVQPAAPAPAPQADAAEPKPSHDAGPPEPKAKAATAARSKPVKKSRPGKPRESKPKENPPAETGSRPDPATDIRVATLRELPETIQREIPALSIGGYIYAGNPSERSMLINNKLLREGDQVVPGLTLEKMMPSEAILNYRGYRYRMAYR